MPIYPVPDTMQAAAIKPNITGSVVPSLSWWELSIIQAREKAIERLRRARPRRNPNIIAIPDLRPRSPIIVEAGPDTDVPYVSTSNGPTREGDGNNASPEIVVEPAVAPEGNATRAAPDLSVLSVQTGSGPQNMRPIDPSESQSTNDPVTGARDGLRDVEQPLSRKERLQSLRFASSLHLKANLVGPFDAECRYKLRCFSYLYGKYTDVVGGGQPLPLVSMRLATVTDNGTPPKVLGTYIYITGLVTERQIQQFHLAVSQKEIQQHYEPLKLCYDRSVVSLTAAEDDDAPANLELFRCSHMGETLCGGLIRTRSNGSAWTSTVGGLICVNGTFYLMTGSNHAQGPDDISHAGMSEFESDFSGITVSSVDRLTDGDFDEKAEPPIVFEAGVEVPAEAGQLPRVDGETISLPVSESVSGLEYESSHWCLLMIPDHLWLPNYVPLEHDTTPAAKPHDIYISDYSRESDLLTSWVTIIASGCRSVKGRLIGNPSYLVLKGKLDEVWTIELRKNQSNRLQRGDSGSWVIDASARVMGSITAISEGYAYMISFSEQTKQIDRALDLPHGIDIEIPHPFDLLLRLARHLSSTRKVQARQYAIRAASFYDGQPTVMSGSSPRYDEMFARALNITFLSFSQTGSASFDPVVELICEKGPELRNFVVEDMDQWPRFERSFPQLSVLQKLRKEYLAQVPRESVTRLPIGTGKAPSQDQDDINPVTRSESIRQLQINEPRMRTEAHIIGRGSDPQPSTQAVSEPPWYTKVTTRRLYPKPGSSLATWTSENRSLPAEQLAQDLNRESGIRQSVNTLPPPAHRIGRWSIVALILNRTIGSGIFIHPSSVLFYTDSSGVSILIWVAGGLIMFAIILCWLELGLTLPFYRWGLHHGDSGNNMRLSLPRSGGDINYLGYIYKKPHLLMVCIFGMTYLILSSLSAEAIQFGASMQRVVQPGCAEEGERCFSKAGSLGWAVGVITFCAFLNISTRRFSLKINNTLAVMKILFVFATAMLGIIYSSVHGDGCKNITWDKKDAGHKSSVGDLVLALLFALYAYTGVDQPFYILSEVTSPRKVLVSSVVTAMILLLVLFPLINVSYLCVLPYRGTSSLPDNMALSFFSQVSGRSDGDLDSIQSGISSILAVFTLGSILAQTFTGTRVIAEIAREGIIPFPLYFASMNETLVSRLSWFRKPNPFREWKETTPIKGTFLYWLVAVSLVLVAITRTESLLAAYYFLSSLRTLTVTCLLGFFTTAGLSYLKVDHKTRRSNGRRWIYKRDWNLLTLLPWRPWQWSLFSPWSLLAWLADLFPAVGASLALLFLISAVFIPPSRTTINDSIPWWVLPTVGWAIPLLGILWWVALQFFQWKGRWSLRVRRTAYIETDHEVHGRHGEVAVRQAEIITIGREYL